MQAGALSAGGGGSSEGRLGAASSGTVVSGSTCVAGWSVGWVGLVAGSSGAADGLGAATGEDGVGAGAEELEVVVLVPSATIIRLTVCRGR